VTARYEREIIANLERAEQSIQGHKCSRRRVIVILLPLVPTMQLSTAATAALLHEGFEFSKHSGVIALCPSAVRQDWQDWQSNMGKTLKQGSLSCVA